ncbi:MAG: hypothetical protein JO297_03330 [Nitrososphaeraceae archaeon]|nr:hypothetical protein [Nitrososphaeraceae archaeon]
MNSNVEIQQIHDLWNTMNEPLYCSMCGTAFELCTCSNKEQKARSSPKKMGLKDDKKIGLQG